MSNTSDQTLLATLSAPEKKIFKHLLARLTQLNGKIEEFSDIEKQQLIELARNHQEVLSESGFNLTEKVSDSISADVSPVTESSSVSDTESFSSILENEFGIYVLEKINDSLCKGGAGTADAIRYAFHNKWMPDNLKNRDICEELYYCLYDDIEKLNENIQQNTVSGANMDTVVAIGLAWFTTLYQFYHLVETEGDI